MVIDERSRHQLFVKLESVLGADEASTLMEHLPPVGWSDVAVKRDLDALDRATALRLEALEDRMTTALHTELAAQGRHMTSVMLTVVIGVNVALAGLAFAAARLV